MLSRMKSVLDITGILDVHRMFNQICDNAVRATSTSLKLIANNKAAFMLACMGCLSHVAADLMLLDPDGEKTSLLCLNIDNVGKFAFRMLDISGVDGLTQNLGFFSQRFKCGASETMNYTQIVSCLEKGLKLFGVFPSGGSYPLVEKLNFNEVCEPLLRKYK